MEANLISKNQKNFKFFTINPPITSITVSNKKIVRKVIEIKNMMVFPVIYKLRSSDTRAVEINKTKVKLNSNKTEKIELIFHMDYLNTKKNITNENVFVFFESDVCDYKYPISISKLGNAGNKKESMNDLITQNYIERISNSNNEIGYSDNKNLKLESNTIAYSDLKNTQNTSEIPSNSKNPKFKDELFNIEPEVYPTFEANYSEDAKKNDPQSTNKLQDRNGSKSKHPEKQLSIDTNKQNLKDLRNPISESSSLEKPNKRSTSQNAFNYISSNSIKEKLNELNNNPALHTSNATFFPLNQGKESLISSYNSRRNDDNLDGKNFKANSTDENDYGKEYKKIIDEYNQNSKYNEFIVNKEYKKSPSSNEMRLLNDYNPKEFNYQYTNENLKNDYLERFEEFKKKKQNNKNKVGNKSVNQEKDHLEGVSSSVLKERFILLLLRNYEDNKRNYDNIIEIIDFFLSYLKNLELKYSIVCENTKHLDNNLKIYRSLSESSFKNKNYPSQGEKSNLQNINKILMRSSSVSSQKSNLSDNNNNNNNNSLNNKDNLDFNLENILANKKEISFLIKLMKDFLENFSATSNENYAQRKSIINPRIENSANIPHLSNEQIDYLFKEIQNFYALNSELNTYKIQTESLLLNIEAMKKNMKSITSSIENYKNNALKAENDKLEAEKKIVQLINIIKSKDRLIDKLNCEVKGKGNEQNQPRNIKYPAIEIDNTPVDYNERLSYADNLNSILNNDEIVYFKNSLEKKDKYINKLKQKLHEYEREINENKLVSRKWLKENKCLNSDKKHNKRRNYSLNDRNKLRNSSRKNRESYVSLFNSNSSYRANSRSKSKSLSNERDRRSRGNSNTKGNFNETNFTKNLNNNYNYTNVFNKNLSYETFQQQKNELFSTNEEEPKRPSEEAQAENQDIDSYSKEENVFRRNYSTEQNNYENPIYNTNKDYNFKYDIDPENKTFNVEKSSIPYTPKSHINKVSSDNNIFESNLDVKGDRSNNSDFRVKYNNELKDNLLNISSVSGANKYCFNKNLYSANANSYLNIKDDISFTKKNIQNLMNKLSSNKKSLINLIDDLSFSKNEFLRNNQNDSSNIKKFVSNKKIYDNPYEDYLNGNSVGANKSNLSSYKKKTDKNNYLNLVENYDSSEDNDCDNKRSNYRKNSSMII